MTQEGPLAGSRWGWQRIELRLTRERRRAFLDHSPYGCSIISRHVLGTWPSLVHASALLPLELLQQPRASAAMPRAFSVRSETPPVNISVSLIASSP